MRLWLCLFISLFLFRLPAWGAAGRAATLAPLDPRSLGMGGAGLALSGGPLAMRLNPATTAQLGSDELAFSHLAWLGGTFQDQLGYSRPFSRGNVWTGGLGYFSVPDFDSTGGREAAFSAGLAQVDLGFAQQLRGDWGALALGGATGYVNQRLGNLVLHGLTLSLGLNWRTPWPLLRVGAALNQYGSFSTSDRLPMELGMGLSVGEEALRAVADLISEGEGRSQLRLGGEWWVHRSLALRLGLANAGTSDAVWVPSAGMGFRWERWSAGLAWQSRGALGSALLVSLGMALGTPAQASLRTPALVETPRPLPVETTEAVRPLRVVPTKTTDWEAGDFELEAQADGVKVSLKWPDLKAELPKMAGYEVMMGMVPEAPLQKTGLGLLKEPRWSDEMAVRGMTYYFRVRVLSQGGEVLMLSRVKAVQMP